MGGFDEMRNFLCVVLARYFFALLPDEKRVFDVALWDMMPVIRPLVVDRKNPHFEPTRLLRRLDEAARHYSNAEQAPGRPVVLESLVAMMDTPHYVPRNKAATQQQRDRNATDEEEDDECVGSHMDERLYNQLVAQRGGDTEALFIDQGATAPSLPGAAVWRSVNLKFQLWRLITLHLLQHHSPRDGHTLIVDDGVAISTEQYNSVRAQMLANNPDWLERTAFERECLVHQLMIEHDFHSRLILYDDRQFHRQGASRIGEADIKIQAYISPENGARRYLVINQDTDVIFILLLHMRHLLGGLSAEQARATEVWIDTRPPGERHDAPPRPYRYIDVKALYYGIEELFAREYPGVAQPIETLCLLTFSLRTDFTLPFAGCLGVGPARVWNTFSELHSTAAEGCLQFTSKAECKTVVRSKLTQCPSSLRGVLASAVAYDEASQCFVLDHEALSRFYYYLCQGAVLQARQRLQMPTLEVKMALGPQELLLCARELCERLDAHRGKTAPVVEEMEVEETTPQQMFDSVIAHSAQLQGVELQQFLEKNAVALTALTKKATPSLYGVPTRSQLQARICRIAWYMKYFRHGWQSPRHIFDCTETTAEGASLWGWHEQETPVRNSTYNEMRADPDGQYHCYSTLECDNVV